MCSQTTCCELLTLICGCWKTCHYALSHRRRPYLYGLVQCIVQSHFDARDDIVSYNCRLILIFLIGYPFLIEVAGGCPVPLPRSPPPWPHEPLVKWHNGSGVENIDLIKNAAKNWESRLSMLIGVGCVRAPGPYLKTPRHWWNGIIKERGREREQIWLKNTVKHWESRLFMLIKTGWWCVFVFARAPGS